MYICSWPKSSVVQWFIEEKSRSHWAVYRCGFMASSTRCANERVSGKSLRSTWSRTVRKWCNGERQPPLTARVLLQRNTIIVLDESTANVDPETEKTILGVVREKLRDSTVITIAHQLNTTLDCDKVLFLKHGEVAKFDKLDTSMNIEGSELGEMAWTANSNRT